MKSLTITVMYGFDPKDLNALAHVGNFIRRYVQEIIFGEQEGFIRLPTQVKTLDEQLVKAFEGIINASMDSTVDPDINFLPFDAIDQPLRRVLVHCLVQARKNGQVTGTIQLYTVEGQQTYLQYFEDLLAERDDASYFELTNNDVAQAKISPSEIETPTEWREYLESLARCRHAISLYAKKLIDMDVKSNCQSVLDALSPPLASLLFDESQELAGLLTMKHLRNRGGIDSVIDLMEIPEKFAPWICCNRDILSKGEVSLADPFSIVFNKEAYESACKDIRLFSTSDQSIPMKLPAAEFICGVFSQVLMNVKHLNPSKIRSTFTEWIGKQGYSDDSVKLGNWIVAMSTDLPKVFDASSTRDMLLIQIMTHIASYSLHMPENWLATFLSHPDRIGLFYFPFITNNSLAEAIAASGSVGWYLCPRGHPYSVGGCHLPMETSICLHPGCGAQIGGRHHVAIKGNRKINLKEIDDLTKPGYSMDDAMNPCSRGTVFDCAITRLFTHLTLAMISLTHSKLKPVLTYLRMESATDLLQYAIAQARNNLTTMQKALEVGETDAGLVAHLILRSLSKQKVNNKTPYIPTLTDMKSIEYSLRGVYQQTLNDIRARLQSLSGELEQGSRISSACASLGANWNILHEVDSQPKPTPVQTLLWRYREPVTFNHFKRIFSTREGTKENYPLLSAFLREESHLHMIKYTADILAWHNLLFEMFPPSSITRADAAEITNAQAIETKLSRERHIEAFKILQRFCIAFNECLPMIDLIYECQPNPFISGPEGSVDLSGAKLVQGGTKMNEDTPINFSLPSMIRGENDAMSFCTVKLLELMQNAQGKVLNSFTSRSGATILVKSQVPEGSCDIPVQPVQVPPEDLEIPSISYMTDAKILRQQLIVYEREKDFIPLLQIFAKQSLDYGQGLYLDYDFDKIEATLANSLIGGKMPVKLQIRHFQFRGDVKNAGHLSELHLRVPQKPLTPSILESIWQDIDTRDKLMKLMRQVEMCISFIGSIGSSSQSDINGQTFLHQYVLKTLLIEPEVWEQITTQAITQNVQLCHLQSFYVELEEKMYGSPLDKVEDCYREFFTEEETKIVKENAKYFDLQVLIPILRQFLVEVLCEAKWDVSASLKQYLTFITASVDLEELEWFNEKLPEFLQLRHTYQFYYQLLEMV